jgi:hypothetical protein
MINIALAKNNFDAGTVIDFYDSFVNIRNVSDSSANEVMLMLPTKVTLMASRRSFLRSFETGCGCRGLVIYDFRKPIDEIRDRIADGAAFAAAA